MASMKWPLQQNEDSTRHEKLVFAILTEKIYTLFHPIHLYPNSSDRLGEVAD